MTPSTYECALLAHTSYRAALSDDPLEIMCVACVFRNRVLRYGKTYSEILENANICEVVRDWPDIRNPILINPTTGILAQIEGVYRNETPDLTANHLRKNGALWFMRPFDHQDKDDFLDRTILDNPNEHPLIGVFGSLSFYE